jgi:uncharacterized repeat protein (TIGR01451 family)
MKRHVLRVVLLPLVLLSLLGSSITTARAQGVTDLTVTIVADRDKVKPGEMITFTVATTNNGPDAAPFVDVIHSLPDQLQFVLLRCDRGINNDGNFCEYPSLDPGASVVSTLVATPITGTGTLPSKHVLTTAMVSLETAETADPNLGNNIAKIATKLNAMKSHH